VAPEHPDAGAGSAGCAGFDTPRRTTAEPSIAPVGGPGVRRGGRLAAVAPTRTIRDHGTRLSSHGPRQRFPMIRRRGLPGRAVRHPVHRPTSMRPGAGQQDARGGPPSPVMTSPVTTVPPRGRL